MSCKAPSNQEKQEVGLPQAVKERSWLRRHVCLVLVVASAGLFLLAGAIPLALPSPALSQGGRGGVASVQIPTENATVADLGLPDLNPADWVWNGITGFWNKLWQQIVDFFQHQIIDWASSLGFVYITPAALSYKNPMVLAGANWSLTAMDGFVAVLLVISGYQVSMHRYLDLPAHTIMCAALKVLLAAVAANVGFLILLPNIIELSNTMSMGIMGALLQASTGDVSLPLGALNWVAQPLTWAVFILIDFIGAVFLVFVEGVRLAVLDVTILFSPWWIMALSNEATRNWGKLGVTTFFCAVFMQPIQIAVLSLGSAMIANWGHTNYNDPAVCTQMPPAAKAACFAHLGHASISTSATPITLLLGIATVYVACKIPGMMFSSAIRSSVGAVNRDVSGAAKAALGVLLLQKQLGN